MDKDMHSLLHVSKKSEQSKLIIRILIISIVMVRTRIDKKQLSGTYCNKIM